MIELSASQTDVRRAERLLKNIPNGSKRAVTNATNRALTKGRMTVNKSIRAKYTIKASAVKNAYKIKKANFTTLSGRVEVTSPVTRLHDFKFTPAKRAKYKKQVVAEIMKGDKKVIPHAYVSELNGKSVIVARVGRERNPNKMLTGPSVPGMASNAKVSVNVQEEMLKTFRTRLDHEVVRLLSV